MCPLQICLFKSPTAAKASSVSVLHKILQNCTKSSVRNNFLDSRGIDAMVGILSNSFIPLDARGAAAGCLWVVLLPDKNEKVGENQDINDDAQEGRLSLVRLLWC